MAEIFETQGVQIPLTWPGDKSAKANVSSVGTEERFERPEEAPPSSPTRVTDRPVKSQSSKSRQAGGPLQGAQKNPALRPAKDVLNRIRHDPTLNVNDFVIGYHDRHISEMQEMDVSAWKGGGDTTDEEWIPQHRIEYFRRKDENGRKIWHRSWRLDRLFGSGLPQVDSGSDSEELQTQRSTPDPEAEETQASRSVRTTQDPQPER